MNRPPYANIGVVERLRKGCQRRLFSELLTTTNEHAAPVLMYLKANSLKLGLLVNFGSYSLATIASNVL
jgi:hypothetical protein